MMVSGSPCKSLERAVGHRGHAVLAMTCVLADLQSPWWPAAQAVDIRQDRYQP
jgi:hypothetical protein